jgi:hypothetical protein
MAMTLRLDDNDERALRELAEAEGVSKHEAVLRAIHARALRTSRQEEVRRHARAVVERYGDVLDRLARS